MASPAATLRSIIDAALAQLVAGEAAEAERSAKAVSALVRAERELAEFEAAGAANSNDGDNEASSAELRRRLALYVESVRAGAVPTVLERIAATPAPE